MSIQI